MSLYRIVPIVILAAFPNANMATITAKISEIVNLLVIIKHLPFYKSVVIQFRKC